MPRLPQGIITKKGRPGYYVRDQRGGKDRLHRAGNTVNEARALRDRLLARGIPPARMTVKDAALRWLKEDVATARNEQGRKLAERRVELDLIPALGGRPLRLLTRSDCRAYRLTLEARKPVRSPQTVAHILADLRRMLLWAEDAGLIPRSPFPRRILPRIQERAPDRLTDEEAAKLVKLPEPWGFYLRLLLGTGIRWGEARRANAQDVERAHLVVAATKNGRVRRVPLEPSLQRDLAARVGRLVHVVNALNVARQGRKVVPRFHVHMTRHTFACKWLEAGGSVTALQEILGHRSVTTTQRYGRPSEDAIRREAERSWTG